MASTRTLLTADARRDSIVEGALAEFSVTGYLGTPVTSIARHANISSAYVFKLFPSKEDLFVAALERCFEKIEFALTSAVDEGAASTPDEILWVIGGGYAELIADRSLLMMQVHAQSASGVTEIAASFRAGIERLTRFAKTRSGATDEAVQRFLAYGQLCHLIVAGGFSSDANPWTQLITAGFRHP